MKWWSALGLLGVLGLGGCLDKEAATSGQIGCAPSKVQISDEDSGSGSQTWTATCDGGDVYYCSYVVTGEKVGQVSCHAASQSNAKVSPQTSPSAPPSPAATESAPPAEPQDAPKTVAGFTFGASVAESAAACTDKGFEWQPTVADHFSCSGAPVSIGLSTHPTLRFCQEKLCAVALDVSSPKAWMKSYAQLNQVLAKKYGPAAQSSGELRSNCATEADFESCVMNDGLHLTRDWKWVTGARLSLRLTAGKSAPELKLICVRQMQSEIAPDGL